MKNVFLFIALIGLTTGISDGQDKLTADTSKTTLSWLGDKVIYDEFKLKIALFVKK